MRLKLSWCTHQLYGFVLANHGCSLIPAHTSAIKILNTATNTRQQHFIIVNTRRSRRPAPLPATAHGVLYANRTPTITERLFCEADWLSDGLGGGAIPMHNVGNYRYKIFRRDRCRDVSSQLGATAEMCLWACFIDWDAASCMPHIKQRCRVVQCLRRVIFPTGRQYNPPTGHTRPNHTRDPSSTRGPIFPLPYISQTLLPLPPHLTPHPTMASENTTDPCAVNGQEDVYGAGVRISSYLQWYIGVLTYIYLPKDAGVPIMTNYLLAIAIAIAVLVNRSDIFNLEVTIVAILLMVPPMSLLMVLGDFILFALEHYWERYQADKKKKLTSTATQPTTITTTTTTETKTPATTTEPQKSPSGTAENTTPPENPSTPGTKPPRTSWIEWVASITVLLATTFLLGVMVWCFWDGVDQMKSAPGCEPKFGSSSYLSGDYRTTLLIWSIALIVFALSALLTYIFVRAAAVKQAKKHQLHPEQLWAEGVTGFYIIRLVAGYQLTEYEMLPLRRYAWLRVVVVILSGALVSACVMTIETIIYQNDIQEVSGMTSAGQLIPLIMGIASLAIVLFLTYEVSA